MAAAPRSRWLLSRGFGFILATGLGAWVPHSTLAVGVSHCLTTGHLNTRLSASRRMNDPKAGATKTEAAVPLNDVDSKVSHHHFCFILFLRNESPSPGPTLRERNLESTS